MIEDDFNEDMDASQQHDQSVNQMLSREEFSQNQEQLMSGFIEGEGFEDESQQQVDGQGEDEEDVIDIDNPDELAAKGLKRIQIEGEEEEFLMDTEGNIYDLRGNFIGTTDGDGEPNQSQNVSASQSQSQLIVDDGDQYGEGDEYWFSQRIN